jgi:molybdenum cofactor synthesis domain-containing protein
VPFSSIIAVGDEILRGFTVDTNSSWLANRLFMRGFPARRIEVVGDVEADIVAAVRDHLKHDELARIFVCGGLGPTPDDRTFAALARAFERPLVYDRAIGAQMQNYLFLTGAVARRGTAALNVGDRKMAMVPQGTRTLRNGAGMAPGIVFQLPPDRYLFALPGVPRELKALFEFEVEPRFLHGGAAPTVRELRYRLAPESAFHDVMLALEKEYPDVSLGSYPQTEIRELILRATGPDASRVEAVLDQVRQRVGRYRPVDS